ncbi:MAG: iron-containing alcohol dehydrogenase, partial [Rikenellaceae bacterium]|nr:iron-containing alcohol dehydrogenase [Rikenellaceae bacterium]
TAHGVQVIIYYQVLSEPTVRDFKEILTVARAFGTDSLAGIGGGSVLDVAKLVAALNQSSQHVEDLFGSGNVLERKTWLACLPTTAGTGSEVSPNAILLDEADRLKKGIVSPFLVPDAAYADPKLTLTVPRKVTAETGMDALTHCIEAYTNKHAHPGIDMYALEGIRLIANNLLNAVNDPCDLEAREALLLGSLYGGLCLGPVNTAAVHALSYPLGGEFHIPHGLANAILLPSVMCFNISADPCKYAKVAEAFGLARSGSDEETAANGVAWITHLSEAIGIPTNMSAFGISRDDIPELAEAAMSVQRLLVNNPREVTYEDAFEIYQSLFE